MKTSDRGIHFLKLHEGWSATVYLDSAGKPTIGYGHLILPGETFDEPMGREEGERLLRHDLQKAEKFVFASLTVPVTQGMFDAMASLCFNIGAGRFGNSTLLRLVNEEKPLEAVREFGSWRRAGGRVVRGLVIRRAREALVFAEAIL